MKKKISIFFLIILLISCGSRKPTVTSSKATKPSTHKEIKNISSKFAGKNSSLIDKILKDAKDYLGTPYKLGGNTSSGIDCSGLVSKVFNENKIKLPRRSTDQALQGKKIENWEIKPGDLLFFATFGNGRVSHVGIVNEIKYNGEITFVNASTTKGVIISSLNELYWNKAFLFAKRIL